MNRSRRLLRLSTGLLVIASLALLARQTMATALKTAGAAPAYQTQPLVSFSSSTYVESEGDGEAEIEVVLSSSSTTSVTVEYLILPGTAVEGSDYREPFPCCTITFDPGETSQSFEVELIDDTIDEPNETVNLVLQDAIGATIGNGTANLTISDNDLTPTNTPVAGATGTPVFSDVYEPNDNLEQAFTISAGATATCLITLWPLGDVDIFRFQAKAGSTYEVLTLNLTPGVDTMLDILSPQGGEIAENDDYELASLASRVVFRAGSDGYYFARVTNNSADDPTNKTYCIEVNEVQGTPTATPSLTPSRVPVADPCEPNDTYETACLIGVAETLTLDFVPPVGMDRDTDIFKLWVKEGILYTCETFELSPVNDTNMIFASGPSREAWFAGNDDKAPGELGSQLSYLATYTGYLYILVGPIQDPDYATSAQYTYQLSCTSVVATLTPTPTATNTPRPAGGDGGVFPTAAPTVTPTPAESPTPSVQASPTPTQRPVVVITPLPTEPPLVTPEVGANIDVTVYLDSNENFMPELNEGIMGIAVVLYDAGTGQLLAFGYTNEAGNVRFMVSTQQAVRVEVPFLSYTQIVAGGDESITLRVAPQPLPGGIP